MVIATTKLAVETGHMHASTQAALVGGSVLTALFFPTIALRLRSGGVPMAVAEGA